MRKDEFCRDVIGIYAMLEDNRTWLLAVDFDDADWQEDVSAFRKVSVSFGIMSAVECSSSGNGALFFSEPADARRLDGGLLTQARHSV